MKLQFFLLVSCVFLFAVPPGKICWARNPLPDHTDQNFENEILEAHNHYRAMHGSSALHTDPNIVAYAKSRCNLISQFDGLTHGHSGLKQGYGENLYWGGSSNPTLSSGSNAVKNWYDEIKQYNFNNPGFSSSTGHFTQVVWKSTTSIGCARCGGKGDQWYETYVTCNYSPPGNVLGKYEENVLKAH